MRILFFLCYLIATSVPVRAEDCPILIGDYTCEVIRPATDESVDSSTDNMKFFLTIKQSIQDGVQNIEFLEERFILDNKERMKTSRNQENLQEKTWAKAKCDKGRILISLRSETRFSDQYAVSEDKTENSAATTRANPQSEVLTEKSGSNYELRQLDNLDFELIANIYDGTEWRHTKTLCKLK